jgi:hypothetical protein
VTDSFPTFTSPVENRHACEIAGKSGKQIERCVVSTFQIAESMAFRGEFRNGAPSPN